MGLDDRKRTGPGLHLDACVGVCAQKVGDESHHLVGLWKRCLLGVDDTLKQASPAQHAPLCLRCHVTWAVGHDLDSFRGGGLQCPAEAVASW